jgi:hypothetical protein
MDWWKKMSTWHYHCRCNLVALKLYNNYSCIVVIELHEVHMYMVSHMVSCIRCNSCSKKYVELQWVANDHSTQKPNYKLLYFFIVKIKAKVQLICLLWTGLRMLSSKFIISFKMLLLVKLPSHCYQIFSLPCKSTLLGSSHIFCWWFFFAFAEIFFWKKNINMLCHCKMCFFSKNSPSI